MNIHIASRNEIEAGILMRRSYLLISIYDSDKVIVEMPPTSMRLHWMGMSFDDAEPVSGFIPTSSLKYMNSYHANEIWAFLRKHQDKCDHLIIQCEQGMSRSPAIGAAVARCLDIPAERFWRKYQPNRYVYDLVVEAFNRLGRVGFLSAAPGDSYG